MKKLQKEITELFHKRKKLQEQLAKMDEEYYDKKYAYIDILKSYDIKWYKNKDFAILWRKRRRSYDMQAIADFFDVDYKFLDQFLYEQKEYPSLRFDEFFMSKVDYNKYTPKGRE